MYKNKPISFSFSFVFIQLISSSLWDLAPGGEGRWGAANLSAKQYGKKMQKLYIYSYKKRTFIRVERELLGLDSAPVANENTK